jgi:hypothetical protein
MSLKDLSQGRLAGSGFESGPDNARFEHPPPPTPNCCAPQLLPGVFSFFSRYFRALDCFVRLCIFFRCDTFIVCFTAKVPGFVTDFVGLLVLP